MKAAKSRMAMDVYTNLQGGLQTLGFKIPVLPECALWALEGRVRDRAKTRRKGRISKRLHGTPTSYLSSVVGIDLVTSPDVNSWLKERP